MVRVPRLVAVMLLLVVGGGRIVAIGCGISCLPGPTRADASTASIGASAGGHCHEGEERPTETTTFVSDQRQDACEHRQPAVETTLTPRAQVQFALHLFVLGAHSPVSMALATAAAHACREHSPPGISAPPIAPLRI